MAKQHIEAIHIAALAIDARQKEGKPGHAKAVRLLEKAKTIWREQLKNRHTCRHCGKKL
jgi:hypothetical protein